MMRKNAKSTKRWGTILQSTSQNQDQDDGRPSVAPESESSSSTSLASSSSATNKNAAGDSNNHKKNSNDGVDAHAPRASSSSSASSAAEPHKQQHSYDNLRWTDLFRRHQPWVLVPHGSLGGYFDFVPEHLRVGPWSSVAILYLGMILAVCSGTAFRVWQHRDYYLQQYLPELLEVHYSPPGTAQFAYNALASVWMAGIAVWVARGPRGLYVWSTYTVQSWTLLAVRHALCALAGAAASSGSYHHHHRWIVLLAELVRFPSACSATITFAVWNFAVQPALYYYLQDPLKRRNFVKFCWSFRLVNLHVGNIAFATLNALWASPPRNLHFLDFYWAFGSVVVYMLFYLLVLDRLGVHLYPVFSPRASGLIVIAAWTTLLLLYGGTFHLWRHAMMATTTESDH